MRSFPCVREHVCTPGAAAPRCEWDTARITSRLGARRSRRTSNGEQQQQHVGRAAAARRASSAKTACSAHRAPRPRAPRLRAPRVAQAACSAAHVRPTVSCSSVCCCCAPTCCCRSLWIRRSTMEDGKRRKEMTCGARASVTGKGLQCDIRIRIRLQLGPNRLHTYSVAFS